jgi:hypothetical protein
MNYSCSFTVFMSLLILYGCVAPRPIDLHVHSHEYEKEDPEILMEMDMPAPEVKARLENLVAADLPTPPIYWTSCGVTTGEATAKMTKFTIVGITEQYVPITGEIKGLVFHVQMSP